MALFEVFLAYDSWKKQKENEPSAVFLSPRAQWIEVERFYQCVIYILTSGNWRLGQG